MNIDILKLLLSNNIVSEIKLLFFLWIYWKKGIFYFLREEQYYILSRKSYIRSSISLYYYIWMTFVNIE